MSSSPSSAVPPGWYPDPSGARQWRVWTGTKWSELTRPYGDAVPQAHVKADLGLIQALYRVVRWGIVGALAGMSVVVGVLAHWPGTAHPASQSVADIALDAGVALIVVGSATFVFAARELEGRWSIWSFIPGVNLLLVSGLVAERLGGRAVQRVVPDIVLLALFASQFHAQPWLCVAPVIVALTQARWTAALIEQLSGPATGAQVRAQ